MIDELLELLKSDNSMRRVTKLISPTYTVKLTRQRRVDKSDLQETFLLTLGKPNFEERKLIKICKEVGEPFPVRNTQLKFFPAKK